MKIAEKISTWFITRYLRHDEDIIVHLGATPAPGRLFVALKGYEFWKGEPVKSKIISILTRRWNPTQQRLKSVLDETLMVEVFGGKDDFGPQLQKNIIWYYKQNWTIDRLIEDDTKKVESLEALTLLTQLRLGRNYIPLLTLKIGERAPMFAILSHPMLVKVPVISFQFFLHIDCRFSFNSIRKANHPHANLLIAYLYELLSIQQKIATSLHNVLLNIHNMNKRSDDAVLTESMFDTIKELESVIVNLKASIEKNVVLLGYIFDVKNLDSVGEHKKRLNKLLSAIPEKVKENYYFELINDFISSENLEKLNNFRTGILHKRGISSFQPHKHYKSKDSTSELMSVFNELHEEHIKSTLVLLCSLAILTDDLVIRDPPTIDNFELLLQTSDEFNQRMQELAKQNQMEKESD